MTPDAFWPTPEQTHAARVAHEYDRLRAHFAGLDRIPPSMEAIEDAQRRSVYDIFWVMAYTRSHLTLPMQGEGFR